MDEKGLVMDETAHFMDETAHFWMKTLLFRVMDQKVILWMKQPNLWRKKIPAVVQVVINNGFRPKNL